MGELLGADPDALDHLARALATTGDDLATTRKRLDRPIHSTPWNGRNADRFRRNWDHQYGRALTDAAAFLKETGSELHRQADQQRRTSGDRSAILATSTNGQSGHIAPSSRSQREQTIIANRRRARELGLTNTDQRQIISISRSSGRERITEVVGDLATADHVIIHIPGISTNFDSYDDGIHGDAARLFEEANRKFPGRVAVVSFADYEIPPGLPDLREAASDAGAKSGVAPLQDLVRNLHDEGFTRDQLSVVAHSYGSVVTGHAMQEGPGLDVGRVLALGSPGMNASSRVDLGSPWVDVSAGSAPINYGRAVLGYLGGSVGGPIGAAAGAIWGSGWDYVSDAPRHGLDPTDSGFNARSIKVPDASGHSEYFEAGSASLENIVIRAVSGK